VWVTTICVHSDSHYLRNRSTLDIGVLGYIGILYHKEHPPEVWHIPPGTLCIFIYVGKYFVKNVPDSKFQKSYLGPQTQIKWIVTYRFSVLKTSAKSKVSCALVMEYRKYCTSIATSKVCMSFAPLTL
jgi:hypothetical protein